eukprot:gnl/TRDRNA2_/TRDRNA2_81043_c0_seq2.p1 gnl/TRDRNA2_/TRDRNA2_81043_c0~~gnl/TRDRNA2_/TRDRNA2_81043_c0_seq2.p1  ORF type:complete len:245 (+),score=33.85 gnl/TRDRNA2_/TRDRNA2_81043_c0_seq2:248-982(+)
MLNINGPAIRNDQTDCVHRVPKNMHFIWVGSPLKENHARNILAIAEQNPAWSIYLWVDHDLEKQQEEELQKIAKRQGGSLFVKVWIPGQWVNFRNWEIIQDQLKKNNFAGASDYIRYEAVYLHGGMYVDVDTHPVHSLENYEGLFDWPFVTYETEQWKNMPNGIFAFDAHSSFLNFALDAARENCMQFNYCGVLDGAGPAFLTAAVIRWNDPDILLLHQNHFVVKSPDNIMFSDLEGSWREHGG